MRLHDVLLLGLPMLDAEDKGGSGGTEKSEGKTETDPPKDESKDTSQDTSADDARVKELRRRANTLQSERDEMAKRLDALEKADKKRREDEAAEAGKFEELAQTREQERDSAIQERDALKAENLKLRDTLKAGVEEDWKALPEEVRKVGEKSYPEDDVMGRYSFLTDPDTKALVAKIAGNGDGTSRREGNTPPPKPRDGATTGDDDVARRRNAHRYG